MIMAKMMLHFKLPYIFSFTMIASNALKLIKNENERERKIGVASKNNHSLHLENAMSAIFRGKI